MTGSPALPVLGDSFRPESSDFNVTHGAEVSVGPKNTSNPSRDPFAISFTLMRSIALERFGCPTPSEEPVLLAFLELSTSLLEDYTSEPTFDLAVTLFLQHTCVLRTGSSNRSRTLISQAVQVAHDLGINRGFHTGDALRASRFYLLLYFADQYSSLTHNTAPCIKPDDYLTDIYQPLVEAYPHLDNLVKLLTLNGEVFYKLHNLSYTQQNINSLEAEIGTVCSRISKSRQDERHGNEGFGINYTTLVQIHMFWSRILLRVPLLMSPDHWLCSLSICVRASQMLLSVYFKILGPTIHDLAKEANSSDGSHLTSQLRKATTLPPTWRQVCRITTSIFVIMYAFWHNEVSNDEAARSCACAILLLEFHRTRWAKNVEPIQATVRSLAALSDLRLHDPMESLLRPGNEAYVGDIIGVDLMRSSGQETFYGAPSHDEIPTISLAEENEVQTLAGWDYEMGDIFNMSSTNFGLSFFSDQG
ncbi:hypothetical protein ZTR_09208 [Talaromyces verruculosus]|nr:hypothetical protein ZTR_09208 [Talaromyces verruculosus]